MHVARIVSLHSQACADLFGSNVRLWVSFVARCFQAGWAAPLSRVTRRVAFTKNPEGSYTLRS